MGTRRGDVSHCFRWLAAPPTLLALLLLMLNDRVWKDQWPGVLTGKLSDVAGLVVAPPLLALALSMCRVARPAAWAVGITGVAFTFAKATAAGAEFASAAWSLAMPSIVRYDPTDLAALPALWIAWRAATWAARTGPTKGRRALLALGSLALPCAVFATAATSACSPAEGLQDLTVYEGVFTGGTGVTEQRIVTPPYSAVSIDNTGQLRLLAALDSDRLARFGSASLDQVCSAASPRLCWRRARDWTTAVDASTDGGLSWQTDFVLGAQELKTIREDVGERCGSPPEVGVVDLAVLDGPAGQVVAAAAANSGLLLRGTSGDWERLALDDILSSAQPAPHPDPDQQLYPVEPAPGATGPTGSPTGSVGPAPSRACSAPATRTYTPDPRNGPPVTVTGCP